MTTEMQIKANRKNALKSTGPRTEEGKDASSQNATTHGLCAKKNVIKTESQDEFALYRDNMIADLSPDGAMEEMLAPLNQPTIAKPTGDQISQVGFVAAIRAPSSAKPVIAMIIKSDKMMASSKIRLRRLGRNT